MSRDKNFTALLLTLALHAGVWLLASGYPFQHVSPPQVPKTAEKNVFLELIPPPRQPQPEPTSAPPTTPITASPPDTGLAAPIPSPSPSPDHPRASMAAPPPPSAEEWAFAAQYTNKNSKGYRYSWGQQVRSMMGTAVEGPDQGVVRFRIEIAPDGRLTQLQTLWTTSAKAEQLARQAIQNMPPLPPIPTGKPLIFDKTISFSPFANDGPPIYRDDCLPEPPVFRNPFAWDGTSPQVVAAPTPTTPMDPQALADCLRQLPKDSIEAESARDQRLMDQWGASKTEKSTP
ncbi:energy transducer TonB [Limnohabitans sp. DCL3]|uniref:energy transducer TonB family protein n=1 Tax=Limnohabitans sp. DCL3 TaxID=3374103 RepID=UPI003A8C605A